MVKVNNSEVIMTSMSQIKSPECLCPYSPKVKIQNEKGKHHKHQFPIDIVVFNENDFIVHVTQGLSLSTA